MVKGKRAKKSVRRLKRLPSTRDILTDSPPRRQPIAVLATSKLVYLPMEAEPWPTENPMYTREEREPVLRGFRRTGSVRRTCLQLPPSPPSENPLKWPPMEQAGGSPHAKYPQGGEPTAHELPDKVARTVDGRRAAQVSTRGGGTRWRGRRRSRSRTRPRPSRARCRLGRPREPCCRCPLRNICPARCRCCMVSRP